MSASGGRLTTHVLDTMHGRPGRGVRMDLFRLGGERHELLASTETNADGRCDRPLLEGERLHPGTYELVFHVGDYFATAGVDLPEPRFFDAIPVRFSIASAEQHYHVPLLISPYGYSTYRGS